MYSISTRVVKRSLLYLAALVLSLLANPVQAQQPRPGAPGTPASDPNDPVNQERTNKTDLGNREWLLANNRKLVRKPGFGPTASVAPQISEDFERIQVINREMLKTVFVDNVINKKEILKTVAEIRKRAARLRTNLSFPEPDNLRTSPATSEDDFDIKLLLARLDHSIMNFVTNPIFQLKQEVVEMESAKKAAGDLRDVIDQSDKIKTNIQTLNNSDGKQ